MQDAGIEARVKDIRVFARYFCDMALGREQNATLGTAFRDLRELKVDVAYPFLLELLSTAAEKPAKWRRKSLPVLVGLPCSVGGRFLVPA